MQIALLQLNSSDSINENISLVLNFIQEAAAKGAQLICTPECTHLMESNKKAVLEKAFFEGDDPALKAFCGEANRLGVWILIGSLIVKSGDDRLANRSFLIGPEGNICGRYDKVHLFDVTLAGGESYRESALYDAGNSGTLVAAPDFTMGMSVCYDLRFPYLYRDYAISGANILAIPAAFTVQTGEAHWEILLRARAIETGCYVIAPAQVGLHATGRSTYGHSMVIDPWGKVVAEKIDGVGVLMAEIDLDNVTKARQKIPSLQHGRDVQIEET